MFSELVRLSYLTTIAYPDEVNQKVKWARKTHTRINKAALDNMHLCVLRYLLLRSAKQPPQLKGVLGSFKVALLPFSMEEYMLKIIQPKHITSLLYCDSGILYTGRLIISVYITNNVLLCYCKNWILTVQDYVQEQ